MTTAFETAVQALSLRARNAIERLGIHSFDALPSEDAWRRVPGVGEQTATELRVWTRLLRHWPVLPDEPPPLAPRSSLVERVFIALIQRGATDGAVQLALRLAREFEEKVDSTGEAVRLTQGEEIHCDALNSE